MKKGFCPGFGVRLFFTPCLWTTFLLAAVPSWGQVVVYPAPAGAPLSANYAVTVNGTAVPVYDAQMTSDDADYASFDMGGCVTIQVAATGGFPNFHLRPQSDGWVPSFNGNTVTFILAGPRNFILQSNGSTDPLFIFANPMETGAPTSGSPTVVFYGPGLYNLPAPVTLNSNQTLYLAGGALVYGQVVVAPGASGVCIRGRGILSGMNLGSTWLADSMVMATDADSVTLRDVILADAPPGAWTSVFWGCDNVWVDNYKVLAQNGHGCDGLDLVSTRQAEVRDSFFYTDDDDLALKARELSCPDGSITCAAPPSQDIDVQGNVFNPTWSSGVEIGYEIFSGTTGPIQAVTVENNDFTNVYSDGSNIYAAFSIHDGGDSLVQDIHYWNNRVEDPQGRLFEFAAGVTWQYDMAGQGSIQSIDVNNLAQVSGTESNLANLLDYTPAQASLRGVTFTNFSIDGNPAGGGDLYLYQVTPSDVVFQIVSMTPTPVPTSDCWTLTLSPTSTNSPTPSPTATPTLTSSPTATPTLTPTPLLTATATATASPTITTTPSFTWTSTVTSTPGIFSGEPVIYPNPVNGPGPISIRLPNYLGLADIPVKIYTTAFRLVDKFTANQMAGGSDVSLPLTDQGGTRLANGLYYVVVTTPLGRSIEKLLILR